MPLDAGVFADGSGEGARGAHAPRPRLALETGVEVGAALKRAREGLGLTLDEIAETTRVRARHLAAIEAAEIDQLPSRPFTIGYVRAYAKALGLDADATAARYRTEHPSPDDELRSPVGVRHNRVARGGPWLGLLVGAMVVAIVGWNIARHVTTASPPKPSGFATPHAVAVARANSVSPGPFSVDTPLPAPPEASAPAPYITPVVSANSPTNAAPAAPAAPADVPPTPFVAKGAVYGPRTGASPLIIQAKKSISLEVRGPGGVVYFARQLAAGEAYRVPDLPDLTAQVSNPANAELFEGGVSKGPFPQPQIPLKVNG